MDFDDQVTANEPTREGEPSPTSDDAVALILKQAGRSDAEIASLATLDQADRAAEDQFTGEAPTLTSLFGNVQAAQFDPGRFSPSADVAKTMGDCIDFLLKRKKAGTLLDHQRMLFHEETLRGLAALGFFGLAIPKKYGGSGAQLGDLGPLLRVLTLIHPDLAVMFEVHNFLGPVTPILDFGSEEQRQNYLPRMARGELLGSFALTEPGAGADPSRLALTARRDGNDYVVSGIKWPITNVIYGGICILVLKLEGEGLPAGRDSGMLIFEVPQADNEHFRMIRNRLAAFDYLWNARFRLTNFRIPVDRLLGPPGKGLAQAFSSLAKGRGGICVNSAAKIFSLLAHVVLDPNSAAEPGGATRRHSAGGWVAFRKTFGKPMADAPRIQAWIGRATTHALASRVLGDICFRLGARGVRDETMGMIAKVYATKALLQSAIDVYQIQGGRSVHRDERRLASRGEDAPANQPGMRKIENYVGENMHEFTIASVYEGPNSVLSDVGAPNAMTRGLRTKYLEPIGLAEVNGRFGWIEKARFAWFVAGAVVGSLNPWVGSLEGLQSGQNRTLFAEQRRLIRKGLRRNRVLGRRILLIIARYQRSFMDESFLLGDEGGIFDQLTHSVASLAYAITLDGPDSAYLPVARALDIEAEARLRGRSPSPALQSAWAEVGRRLMDPQSPLFNDLIADIEVSDLPLDPRIIDAYI